MWPALVVFNPVTVYASNVWCVFGTLRTQAPRIMQLYIYIYSPPSHSSHATRTCTHCNTHDCGFFAQAVIRNIIVHSATVWFRCTHSINQLRAQSKCGWHVPSLRTCSREHACKSTAHSVVGNLKSHSTLHGLDGAACPLGGTLFCMTPLFPALCRRN